MTVRENPGAECPEGFPDCHWLGEVERLRSEIAELLELVHTDSLTGLCNHRRFSEALEHELERTRRTGYPLAMLMMDLDFFKKVNDTWGHEAGNQTLRHVAELLKDSVRRIDLPCRYGGEEFAILLPSTPLAKAVQVAERIRDCIENSPIELEETTLKVTASIGVGVYHSRTSETAEHFIERVDSFLYKAKADGRNQVAHPPFESDRAVSEVSQDEKNLLLGG